MKLLLDHKHKAHPENPLLENLGDTSHVQKVYASVEDAHEQNCIDMVDMFCNSYDAGFVVYEAIEIGSNSVWLQVRFINEEAVKREQYSR